MGCDTLSLGHPAEPTSASQSAIANERLPVSVVYLLQTHVDPQRGETAFLYSLTAQKTWLGNIKKNTTYIPEQ